MNDVKLLPCPFCGHAEPYFERAGTPRQSCIVACGNCGCRHESSDEGSDSGRQWNTRADATCALRGALQPEQIRPTYYVQHLDGSYSVASPQPCDLDSSWQSIDSAPRDGSHVLLYRKHIRFVGFYAPNGECWVHNAPGLPLINPEPTHWSPLREMPTPEGVAK